MTYQPKPGEVVTLYFVSYMVPGKKNRQKTRYRMHPTDAAKLFANVDYRLESQDSITVTSPESACINLHAHFTRGV